MSTTSIPVTMSTTSIPMSITSNPDTVVSLEIHEKDPAQPSTSKKRSAYSRAKGAVKNLFLRKKRKRGPQWEITVKTFTKLGASTPVDIDDRSNIFQEGIKVMSTEDADPEVIAQLNETVVGLLHNEKERPRPTDFRVSAIQSSPKYPFMRRVTSAKSRTPARLPDSQLVFDGLFKQPEDSFIDHLNGISGLALSLALIIQLSLVRISGTPESNDTTPYLDLSPLYGANDSETNIVRVKDGRGMLSPDCFFDNRVMILPPATSALLLLLNRNHNHIAEHLLLNNEDNKWVDPSDYPSSENGVLDNNVQKQDDEIFAIARLINCVQFKNVVAEDFLKILIGLPHVGGSTNMDILIDHRLSEKGKGHVSSVEFSLLYNWTTMMRKEDIEEMEEMVDGTLSAPLDQVTDPLNRPRNANPRMRDCGGLKRGLDGRFKEEDIARVLQDASEFSVGAPGARRTPTSLSKAEVMMIERARHWGVCSLNDFRKFLGLKALKSFEEWNSDPDVAGAARSLYNDINNLELYPGLQAEESMPGSGFGFGYTMTYGLLVDIVTTIRCDARFTTECTPGILTQWGYDECSLSLHDGASKAMLPRLLQRNFPAHYPYDNIYGLFPLTCVEHTRNLLDNTSDLHHNYDCERPEVHEVKNVEGKEVVDHIMSNSLTYRPLYGKDADKITDAYGAFVLDAEPETFCDHDQMKTLSALTPDESSLPQYAATFARTADTLINDKSTPREGQLSVDIAGDVINMACTRWVVETLCGISLSDPDEEVMAFHRDFTALHAYAFKNNDPEHGWAVRKAALDARERLGKDIARLLPIPKASDSDPDWDDYIEESITDVSAFLHRIYLEMSSGKDVPHQPSTTFLARVVKSNPIFGGGNLPAKGNFEDPNNSEYGITGEESTIEMQRVVTNVLGLAVVIAIHFAQTCVQAVDFYLDDERSEERKEIIRLSTMSQAEAMREDANKKLMVFIRAAQRNGPPMGLWRNAVQRDTILQGQGHIEVAAGDRIFVDLSKAYMNTPNTAKDVGIHKNPATRFVEEIMPELFKTIFRLKNLRRNTEKSGRPERYSVTPGQSDRITKNVPVRPVASLSVLYDDDGSLKRTPVRPKKKWRILAGAKNRDLRRTISRILVVLTLFLLLWFVLTIIRIITSSVISFALSWVPKASVRAPPPKMEDVQVQHVDCPPPTSIFQPYKIYTFLPGADGQPIPLNYTLDYPKPHKLSIVDIDARDLRMAVYVNDILRGITTSFEFNKTVNCGEDVRSCLMQRFSAGLAVVKPGEAVRVEWIGEEFIPDTHNIDWGNERSRRIKWQIEYCS